MWRQLVLPAIFTAILSVASTATFADTTTSYVGTLANSEDIVAQTVVLASVGNVTLQTYGFGGGTNGNGTAISPGGTDDFVGLFSGAGASATFINGGSLFDNFSNGCPPAGTVSDFGDTTCGDESLTFTGLTAGTYTVLLTDGSYLPDALFDNGTLGAGFLDFTGGQFCNIFDLATSTLCPNVSGAYALDVTTSGGGSAPPPPVPEPSPALLLALGLLCFAVARSGHRAFARLSSSI